MSSQVASKSSKPTKPSSRSSGGNGGPVSSHLAMVELKQRILISLSRLGDRDTYQIAVDDLEKIIVSMTPETLQILINCLFESSADPKTAVKKESLRLLSFLCLSHRDLSSAQLAKIIAHIVKRLKDADSGVRDACRGAIGSLSAQLLKDEDRNSSRAVSLVGLFAKPLFEAMSEQNKSLQSGAAICMAKMVESATDPPVMAFQKLCPKISKLLNSPNYLTKASLLPVVTCLSQVRAIAPQSLESLLQSIHECLGSTDWVTRKAAADALIALATYCSGLIRDKTESTLTVLETCRFDKIKPVRDSLNEAVNAWSKIGGKGNGSLEQSYMVKNEDTDSSVHDEAVDATKESSDDFSNNSDSISKAKNGRIPEKIVLFLKKKAPRLNEKDLNPDFFQKLETRGSGDCPVEVIVPRMNRKQPNSIKEDELETNNTDSRGRSMFLSRTGNNHSKQRYFGDFSRENCIDERIDQNDAQYEGALGNWDSLQRQLLLLERQQTHIMNMLKDFVGGSHDGMTTLENRVKNLERTVEEMSKELLVSSDGRGRTATWRSELDGWDCTQYGASRNGPMGTRRVRRSGLNDNNRLDKSETDGDHIGSSSSRRAWNKGHGPIRFSEGPSARSIWQASKDEATLEAIRVAGEDCGASMEEGKCGDERDPVWLSWSNAMHALRVGDTDSAFAEVLSIGDDDLLIKFMDKTGPVLDNLSNDIGNECLHAIGQFLLDLNLFDICLSWIQQLQELVAEKGPDFLAIPLELKKELLLNLHEAASTIDPLDDLEGLAPDDLLVQLASNWAIELQHFD